MILSASWLHERVLERRLIGRRGRASREAVRAVRRAYGRCSFISLGNHCYTAHMLKTWGLKPCSMPFDWIFSNNAMIAHCVEDEFSTLLDPSYFRPLPRAALGADDRRACDHLDYRERFGVLQLFNHRDPSREKDLLYYRRCVDRFATLRREGGPVVFVLTSWDLGTARDDFFRLEAVLRRRFARMFLLGAVVRHQPGPKASCTPLSASDGHLLLEMVPRSTMLALRFEAPDDDAVLQDAFCAGLLRHGEALTGRAGEAGPSCGDGGETA